MHKIPFYNLLELSQHLTRHQINKISDKILDNKLIIKYRYIPESLENIPEILTYNENFNWEIRFEDKSNMAMLHLHSLDPIKYLLLSYYQSKNINIINKSLDLLFSWDRHAVTNPNFYTWYTHCVSDRTLIIGIMLLEAQNNNYENEVIVELERMLKTHKEYLIKKENYRELNHGTMIDRSLIFSSLVLMDRETLEFSTNRLKENFEITFTENMVCVENSMTYSIFNLELFISVEKDILNPANESISEYFDSLINKSLDFIDDVKMPDETFPHFGDGEKVSLETLKNSIIFSHYSHHKLFKEYKLSDQIQSHIYQKEGYIILKNENKYLLCNSGSLRINHKHADDGSIIYYNDEEIFIDSGIYSYDKNSLRSYFKSNVAHNSLVLNNESYDYTQSKINDGYIENHTEDNDYFYVQLINNHYKYANIVRHLFILKDDFQILIHDQIISPIQNINTQLFNLSPTVNIDSDINKSKNIKLNNRIIMNTDPNVDITVHNVENNMGKYAKTFHSLINIPKLELSKYGPHQNITTLIQNISIDTFNIDTKFLEFNKLIVANKTKQFIVDLLPVQKTISLNNYLFIKNINNKYFWKVFSSNYTDEEYAFYIYQNDSRYDIIWYSENKIIEYDFNEPGTYTIRCFIRNKNNHDEKVAFRSGHEIIIND